MTSIEQSAESHHHVSTNVIVRALVIAGAIVNAGLAALKICFGQMSGFYALLADGVHTLSDLLTDILVLLASIFGGQAADESHPYGHQRIETAATFILSLFLAVTGWFIIHQAYTDAFKPVTAVDSGVVTAVIVISLVIKELLFWLTLFYAKQLDSNLLRANAWHHRSDGFSSLVVLIGVMLHHIGWYHADTLASVIVGCSIIYMGWLLGWNSFKELIDTALDADEVKQIYARIRQTPGVVAVHQLRTRSMAGKALLDVHILVSPLISVSEGHFIAQNAAINVRDLVSKIDDVTIHVDPEDDEVVLPSLGLPTREVLCRHINVAFVNNNIANTPKRTVFHYLDGQLQIEIYVDVPLARAQCDLLRADISQLPNVSLVKFFQECHLMQ